MSRRSTMMRGTVAGAIAGGVLAIGTNVACKKPPAESQDTKMVEKPAARSVRIEETTVRTIDGWKVTVANVMKGKWTLPDGKEREGTSAVVGLYDEKKADRGERTVGEGAVVEIAGKKWTVVQVAAGKGAENGSIELREGG